MGAFREIAGISYLFADFGFPGLTTMLTASGSVMIKRPGTPYDRLVSFLETSPPVIILFDLDFTLVLLVPFLELGHSRGLIEESQLYTAQEVFQVQYTFERQDLTNGVGGLSTFV